MVEEEDWRQLQRFLLEKVANDGKLDMDEVEGALALALRDGVIDEHERRMLHRLLDLVPPEHLSADAQARLQQIRDSYSL